MEYKKEEDIRKDFARIFGWYETEFEYGYTSQKKVLRTPEWAEIFAEVGKLKKDSGEHYLWENIRSIERRLDEKPDRIYTGDNPNEPKTVCYYAKNKQ